MAQQRSVTRDVPRLDVRADVVPSSLNAEKRTVEVVWTTGEKVLRGGWFTDPYFEELSLDPKHVRMSRLTSGNAPLLNSHRSYDINDVIGVVESAKLEGKSGTATVRFARSPEGEAAFQLVSDGILRNISVGYRVHRLVKVEGGEAKTPTYRAEDWEPFELSTVPIGADAGAVTRSGGGMTPCVFIEETRDMKIKDESATDQPASTTTTATPQPANADEQRATADRERERILGIQRRGATLERPQAEIDEAIRSGTTLEAFTAEAVDKRAAAQTVIVDKRDPRVAVGEDLGRKGAAEGLRSALLHRTAPQVFKLDDAGRIFRGMTLLEMARRYLEIHGAKTDGLSKREIASMALGFEVRAGQHSTSDFPLILADVAGKSLRASYEEAPQTFQTWARRVTLPDFKPVKRTQMGEAPQLKKVLEGAEFTRGTIGEAREVYELATYGRTFAITRQSLINDDTDAFSRVPTLFGRSARDLESDLVYAHFLSNPVMGDGTALFHANHGNTGAGVISVDNVGAGRAAMRKQKGLDKKQRINVQAKYLLVPAALETKADQFVSQNMLADATGNINVFAGRLQAVAEPRLDDDSALQWYLATDPASIDTLEYGYLEGEDGPFVESRVGFDVDGLEIKCRHDFATKAIDWRGFYRSTGV